MLKHIARQAGKWVDKNNNGNEFHGHVIKDLALGDRFEEMENGQLRLKEVMSKIVNEQGYTLIEVVDIGEVV
jgi:hypothetical protein